MPQIAIDVQPRTDFGKGAARRLRAAGRVPAVIYGPQAETVAVSLPGHDLMMALKVSEVILTIDLDGSAVSVAPRQVQRDPVRRTIEHVDLLVLSAQQVRERLVVGRAVAVAEELATAAELEVVAVITALHELLDEGMEPEDAARVAVERVQRQVAEQASAAAAAAAAEDAAAAEAAAESGPSAEG